MKPNTLWTIGHSTRSWEAFVELLQETDIAVLADVRRFAGSRRNPQFSRDAMPEALAECGIRYWPLAELGGRRSAAADSPNTAWRVDGFRAYADHLGSREYIGARERLMRVALNERVCVMCAEAVWWRCHRRLIADDFVARGWTVMHVLGANLQQQHELHADAVFDGNLLVYPARQASLYDFKG